MDIEAAGDLEQAGLSEHLPRRVARLGKRVGIEDDEIAAAEPEHRFVVGSRVLKAQREVGGGTRRLVCVSTRRRARHQDAPLPGSRTVPKGAGMAGIAQSQAVAIGQVGGDNRRREPPQLRVRGKLLVEGSHQARLALAVDIPAQQ